MILALEQVAALAEDNLRSRRSKDGQSAARGIYIAVDAPFVERPLQRLEQGEKLHIVGIGSAEELSGMGPAELLDRLRFLGLSANVHLKQIHLIADDTGLGEEASFAARFAAAIAGARLQVDEIKAPAGKVKCAADGKIWVQPAGADWRPSCPELNYYAGPRVQPKHLRLRPAESPGA